MRFIIGIRGFKAIKTEKYYTAKEHLLNIFEREARQLAFAAKSEAEMSAWRQNLQIKLTDIIGLDKMQTCALNPTLLESTEMDGYRRDTVIIQTEPDVWMSMYVLIPGNVSGRTRCIVAPHGHSFGGKYAVAGRDDIPVVKKKNEEYRAYYGLDFVKRGYVVFCPDARGFGERREFVSQGDDDCFFTKSSCGWLNKVAISLGRTLTGMFVWDLMRLLDYIQTRPDCAPDRIACAGLSGGGMQTLWLSALDERIKCAVISGYFYGYKEALMLINGCDCNYVPGLWKFADMGDIAAMIAPRPLLIEAGSNDPLNGVSGTANVKSQILIAGQAYELLENKEKLEFYIFEGEHRWDGKMTYDFVDKWI